MSSAVTARHEITYPLFAIISGALLLLFSLTSLLIHFLLPPIASLNHTIPTISTLILLIPGAGYLLTPLVAELRWRIWLQLGSSALMFAGSLLLLIWLAMGYSFSYSDLSPPNTLLSLALLGSAALIQVVACNLTQLGLTFLLILAATSLAIFGIIAQLLGYDPLFPWYGVHHMSLLSASGLLTLASGLAYMTWWGHRSRRYDMVNGISLLASILLLFTMLLGSGLIYAVYATQLHFEAREALSNLLKERSARVVTMLHEAESHASLLAYEALDQERSLWAHHFAEAHSLRITDRNGRVVRSHNGEWFERKSVATIDGAHSQLWRGETGPCQLRTTELQDGYKIEVGIALDLLSILEAPLGNDGLKTLKLCAQQPDGALRCLSAGQHTLSPLPPLQQGTAINNTTGDVLFYLHDNTIQAVMDIPEYGLNVILEQDQRSIFGALHTKLALTLPLALLLLMASVALIIWRIRPLARALQHNEQRYHSLVDGAADAIFLHDSNRCFLETNPAATTLLGYPHEQLIGMHPDDLLLPEDQAEARAQLETMRQHGAPINTRRMLRRQDGTQVPVEIRATRLDNGQLISVVRDISEQVRHEEQLQEKERLTRSVVEVLAEGVVVQQTDGAIIYSNHAAQQILGQDGLIENQVTSYDPLLAVIHEDGTSFPGETHPAMAAIHLGTSQRGVVMGVLRPDGERVWISVNSDPLWDDAHTTIIGAVTSFTDVTHKRNTEHELLHSQVQLRALSNHLLQVREDEKMAIAREIHDELGSNLTAIRMVVEWLNGELRTDNPQLRERLNHLSRVTAETILATRTLVTHLRPTLVEDLGLWAALEWLLREACINYPIEVTHNLMCSHIELPQATALTLYRVIQEALNNIIKHANAHKIHLECWSDEESIHITLEDNGIGLDEETSHNIDSYGIRGMYERIEQLHGTIELLGTPGEGTLVVITIPYHLKRETI